MDVVTEAINAYSKNEGQNAFFMTGKPITKLN
jgi:hypothetical protein